MPSTPTFGPNLGPEEIARPVDTLVEKAAYPLREEACGVICGGMVAAGQPWTLALLDRTAMSSACVTLDLGR